MRRSSTARIPIALAWFLAATLAGSGSAQSTTDTPPPPPKPAEAGPLKVEAKPTPRPRPAPSRKKANDEDVVVMSAEAMARARGKVVKDQYDAEPDWASLAPWEQTAFFGIKAKGKLFIYVVDCSGSMSDNDRLDRAKTELRRTINALQQPQRFKVIFYNDRPVPMPGELPKLADYPSKSQLSRWMNMVQPEGGTDPRSALALALAYRPDAVFLLSDGAYPEGTADEVARLNPKKVPIHCIDLANGAAGDDLRKIAADSGGQYSARGR